MKLRRSSLVEPVMFAWNERSLFWANRFRVDPGFLGEGDAVRIDCQTDAEQRPMQGLYLPA